MPLKDYYRVLELEPEADELTIKKNFRRLALRYHPDTNPNNPYAEAWFRELKEAYETLTDPDKKNEYLQARWLLKSRGLQFAPFAALTPDYILLQSRQLKEQVDGIDQFRMNHQALRMQIEQLLNHNWLEILQHYDEHKTNFFFVENIMSCIEPLMYTELQVLTPSLDHLANYLPETKHKLAKYLQQKRTAYFWERYQTSIIIIISLVLCAVIFVIAK